MEVFVAAVAEEGRVAAGFEAALAVTALGAGGALETSRILFFFFFFFCSSIYYTVLGRSPWQTIYNK